jgi:hypothetical protein
MIFALHAPSVAQEIQIHDKEIVLIVAESILVADATALSDGEWSPNWLNSVMK